MSYSSRSRVRSRLILFFLRSFLRCCWKSTPHSTINTTSIHTVLLITTLYAVRRWRWDGGRKSSVIYRFPSHSLCYGFPLTRVLDSRQWAVFGLRRQL